MKDCKVDNELIKKSCEEMNLKHRLNGIFYPKKFKTRK